MEPPGAFDYWQRKAFTALPSSYRRIIDLYETSKNKRSTWNAVVNELSQNPLDGMSIKPTEQNVRQHYKRAKEGLDVLTLVYKNADTFLRKVKLLGNSIKGHEQIASFFQMHVIESVDFEDRKARLKLTSSRDANLPDSELLKNRRRKKFLRWLIQTISILKEQSAAVSRLMPEEDGKLLSSYFEGRIKTETGIITEKTQASLKNVMNAYVAIDTVRKKCELTAGRLRVYKACPNAFKLSREEIRELTDEGAFSRNVFPSRNDRDGFVRCKIFILVFVKGFDLSEIPKDSGIGLNKLKSLLTEGAVQYLLTTKK